MSASVTKFIDVSSGCNSREKRKRNRHACGACRKQKKRCLHDYTVDSVQERLLSPSSIDIVDAESRPADSAPHSAKTSGSVHVMSSVRAPGEPKQPVDIESDISSEDGPVFIGHLDPAGEFLATTVHGTTQTNAYSDDIGYWLQTKHNSTDALPKLTETLKVADNGPTVFASLNQLKNLPPVGDFNALRKIYYTKIHPIFPLIPPEMVPEWNVTDNVTLSRALLMQSMCLAVATDQRAGPFLHLNGTPTKYSRKKWIGRISEAVSKTLNNTGSVNKIVAARVLALLSLFSQLSTNNHIAAEYCARAVSYVQSLSLHLETAHIREDDAAVTPLFLCVWALDRLNAAFHSRPVLIHHRDIGRDMGGAIARQPGCFRAFLVICGLLEDVTCLYRPTHNLPMGCRAFTMPLFDELVSDAGASHCSHHVLATMETLYHAVAMLAYRPDALQGLERSSSAYLRSSLSSVQLTALLGSDIGASIADFPFVPYAVSLALRGSYRELRLNRTPYSRTIARSQVVAICRNLQRYSDTFGFVKRLTALATKTIKELDKAATSVVHNGQRALADDTSGEALARPTSDASNANNLSQDKVLTDPVVAAARTPSESEAARTSSIDTPHPEPVGYTAKDFDMTHTFPDLPDLFEDFEATFDAEIVDMA